jgi:hypothetical protein
MVKDASHLSLRACRRGVHTVDTAFSGVRHSIREHTHCTAPISQVLRGSGSARQWTMECRPISNCRDFDGERREKQNPRNRRAPGRAIAAQKMPSKSRREPVAPFPKEPPASQTVGIAVLDFEVEMIRQREGAGREPDHALRFAPRLFQTGVPAGRTWNNRAKFGMPTWFCSASAMRCGKPWRHLNAHVTPNR